MYKVITSFSDKGYHTYGERFIESFIKYWDCADLWCYTLGDASEYIFGPKYMDLEEDHEYARFADLYDTPLANGIVNKNGEPTRLYNYDAIKFCKKVYAITDPWGPYGWRIWLDADVETFAPVTEEALAEICRPDAGIVYIGREDWHHSETGFLAFNMSSPVVRAFLEHWRDMYNSGTIFRFQEWHDAFVFDRVRDLFPNLSMHNLAAGIPGMHPWPETVLGKYMVHYKGPAAKIEEYGEFV